MIVVLPVPVAVVTIAFFEIAQVTFRIGQRLGRSRATLPVPVARTPLGSMRRERPASDRPSAA